MSTGRSSVSYYADGARLKGKHELAVGSGMDFPSWALGKLNLAGARDVLDAGCGWGRFALPLVERSQARVTCLDRMPGMVATCRESLLAAGVKAYFVVADVQHLPFPSRTFDVVMANHMLYELPDPEPALLELARVLRQDGQLLATTYSDAVRVPLMEFHSSALHELGMMPPREDVSSFSLENGHARLARMFGTVDVHVLEEQREQTAAELVASYERTGRYYAAMHDESVPSSIRVRLLDRFRAQAQQEVNTAGAIHTETRWTAFVAYAPFD